MARFSIVKKGYSVDEVEGFISKLLQLTEDRLTEQSKRINELKGEIRTVTAEKNELKAREISVSQALTEAMRRADEIERAAEARYAIELNRLRLFRKRFTEYISKISDQTPISVAISEFESNVKALESELAEVMHNEFNLINSIPTQDIEQEADKSEESGFDLREALTPKETLEEICKELGLI